MTTVTSSTITIGTLGLDFYDRAVTLTRVARQGQ